MNARNARSLAFDEAQSDVLAIVAHELRTPLTAIIGWARKLGDGRLTGDQSRALNAIVRNALAQERLVGDLFDLVRLPTEVEKRRPEVSPAEVMIRSDWCGRAERDRLREETWRLSSLLDANDDRVALLSTDGRFLYANRRTREYLEWVSGRTQGDIVGKTSAELGVPPELTQRFQSKVARVARGETVVAEELIPDSTGERWFEGRLTPVYGSDGTVRAVALDCRDVHERKLAQRRLELLAKVSTLVGLEYEEVLASIARLSIPELADWSAVDWIDGDQVRRMFLSQRDPAQAALRDEIMRTGPPKWESTGPGWRDLLAGRSLLVRDMDESMLRERIHDEEQRRLARRVGIRSLIKVPIRSGDRIIAILTFVTTDESGRRYGPEELAIAEELARRAFQIVENTRLHEEVRASERRFRIALAGAKVCVYEQDSELRYRYVWSPEFRDMVGKGHADIFPPDEAELLTAIKRRVLETGEPVREEVLLTPGTERRVYRLALEPVRDSSGSVVGLIGAATDISDDRRVQEELSQAVMFRERVMSILGHDLRNPLNTISLSAARLRRQELPEGASAHATRIARAAQRMEEMISTLMDFAQARFVGALPVSLAPADLGEIARDAVDELRSAWPDRTIELEVSGDTHGLWDGPRITQVISNLVANALSHGAADQPIRVRVGDDGDGHVCVSVHNGGPEISRELLPTLFEPFRRGPDERSRGLGLGLFIAHNIVVAHGGTIEVASTSGDGTQFTVFLPRARARGGIASQLLFGATGL